MPAPQGKPIARLPLSPAEVRAPKFQCDPDSQKRWPRSWLASQVHVNRTTPASHSVERVQRRFRAAQHRSERARHRPQTRTAQNTLAWEWAGADRASLVMSGRAQSRRLRCKMRRHLVTTVLRKHTRAPPTTAMSRVCEQLSMNQQCSRNKDAGRRKQAPSRLQSVVRHAHLDVYLQASSTDF